MTLENQLTDQDVVDLHEIGIEAAPARTLLAVWNEVFKSGKNVAAEPIPMMAAHKVTSSWPKVSYQDTVIYHRLYHEYLADLGTVLEETIAKHPEALKNVGAEDATENRELYVDLLIAWHLCFDARDEAWDAGDADSHIQVAAIVDARHFVFSDMGLAGHLGAIGFVLDDEEFLTRLVAAKAEQ